MLYNFRSRNTSISKQTASMSLSEEIKNYLHDLVKPLVKSEEMNVVFENFKEEVLFKIECLERKLVEKEEILNDQKRCSRK